jgi:hypothetical protein
MGIDRVWRRDALPEVGSVDLGEWPRVLERICRNISADRPEILRVITVTRPLGSAAGAPALLRRVAEQLADQHDLELVLTVDGRSATARLSRRAGSAVERPARR